MRPNDFDFDLPPEQIAQVPAPSRDHSRLLVVHRESLSLEHATFRELTGFLRPGDLLVVNDSRVIPARLRAINETSQGRFEVFLLENSAPNDWWVLMRPAKRARSGCVLRLLDATGQPSKITLQVVDKNAEGHRYVRFFGTSDFLQELSGLGEIPLPPYIKRTNATENPNDATRYQTIYARADGSVAAPTAGLHFTEDLFRRLADLGIGKASVTLHVGTGTFAPVKAEELSEHVMHEERYSISEATAAAVNETKDKGGRVIAVGTTSLRVLETAGASGEVKAGEGRTRLFVFPPWKFQVVDGLITNFHLPRSTLLMLVSAFAAPGSIEGRKRILGAYREAIAKGYRFFSYGDAMLIV